MDKEVGTESEKKRERKMRTRGESNGGGRGGPLFLFRPNTYIGTCMSIEHIYMRLQGSRKRYIE